MRPGRETRPTANRVLTMGMRPACIAIRLASTYETPRLSSASMRSAARLTEFIEAAKIMPANGTMKLGWYQGSSVRTAWVTKATVRPPPMRMDTNA